MYKSINIDSELHKELKIFAANRGLTITELIGEAIRRTIGKMPVSDFEKPIQLPPKVKIPVNPISSKGNDICKHGAEKTYCKVASCENYAAWR